MEFFGYEIIEAIDDGRLTSKSKELLSGHVPNVIFLENNARTTLLHQFDLLTPVVYFLLCVILFIR